MAMMPRFAVILGNFGNRSDRFLTSGYGEDRTLTQLFDAAASVEDLAGVELVGHWHVRPDNVEPVRDELARTGLAAVSIIPDHFSRQVWGKGAFCSNDAAVRRQAVQETMEIMDVAAAIGCGVVSLWPGQDGYDYPFQADYLQARDWLVEGVRACADHRTDVRLSLEYKVREPRNHSYISTVGTTLMLVQEIDRPTVGVTIDVGHALAAGENMAESVALLSRYGDKLFHLHFNDNYRSWDDDMIVGSVHTVEFLELLYWLDRVGYDGWYSMDQYPYREEPVAAIRESIQWLKGMHRVLERIGYERIAETIRTGDATQASAMVREALAPA